MRAHQLAAYTEVLRLLENMKNRKMRMRSFNARANSNSKCAYRDFPVRCLRISRMLSAVFWLRGNLSYPRTGYWQPIDSPSNIQWIKFGKSYRNPSNIRYCRFKSCATALVRMCTVQNFDNEPENYGTLYLFENSVTHAFQPLPAYLIIRSSF